LSSQTQQAETKTSRRALLRMFASAFFLFAVGFLLVGIPFWWRQHRIIQTWPKTQAEVVRTEVVPVTSGGRTAHQLRVELVYRIRGSVRTTLYRPERPTETAEEQQKMAANFQPGSVLPIAYQPEDPSRVVVHPGYNFRFFFLPALLGGAALACAVCGVLLLVASFRSAA